MKLVVSSAEKKQTKFRYESLAIVAADFLDAQTALSKLRKIYKSVDPKDADVIIALGGDGFILQTLHRYMEQKIPVFGMNRGSIGFLMNDFLILNIYYIHLNFYF